jgi:lipid-A-disaccharide synthase
MYNAGRWPYLLLARWLITTRHLSIPNILAGREIVPEFMPYYRSIDPIVARAIEWLSTPDTLARVRRDLVETIKPLMKAGAAKNAAKELAATLEEA